MKMNPPNEPRTCFWRLVRRLLFPTVLLFSCVSSPAVLTPARLTFAPGSGLSLTGAVGTVYAIQYTTNLARADGWLTLSFLKLPASPYTAPGTLPTGSGSRFFRAVAVAMTQTNLVHIPAGTFMLGSPSNEVDRFYDEGPQTAVTLTSDFWMAPYLVTQQQYQSLMGTNPSAFTGDLSRPVDQVSWYDASNYCRLLTQQELAAGHIPAGVQFRLPTEAEWEYCCRAGTTTRFNYGDDPFYNSLTNHAWYIDNSNDETQPVGQKPPNAWGLYDMHGDVWEWCQDWYKNPYPGGSVTDPKGPATGLTRVLRGGSWADDPALCRSAFRNYDDPASQVFGYGFRVVLAPIPP